MISALESYENLLGQLISIYNHSIPNEAGECLEKSMGWMWVVEQYLVGFEWIMEEDEEVFIVRI